MEVDKIKEEVINKLKELPRFDDVLFVYLFGSQADGNSGPMSDIDICIYYEIEDRDKLREQLYLVSGSFGDSYDISFFQLLPLNIQQKVFEGELLYTSEKRKVHDIAVKTFREHEDFIRRREYIIKSKMEKEAEI